MVAYYLAKVNVRVRFSLPAPNFQHKYNMQIISYQGVYDGQNFESANTPDQLGKAFNHGFSVVVDVWRRNDVLCIGTENNPIEVTEKYLEGNRVWLNCRNDDAYTWLIAQPRKLYPHVFQFANDTESNVADVTGGQQIVPGNVPINNNSIVFLPEIVDRGLLSTVKLQCYGAVSVYCTFIRRMRTEGQWY